MVLAYRTVLLGCSTIGVPGVEAGGPGVLFRKQIWVLMDGSGLKKKIACAEMKVVKMCVEDGDGRGRSG